MNGKRLISLLSICLLMLVPLTAADLDAVINQAKQQSSTIQMIELNKKNSDLALELKEVKNTTTVAVSGSATFREIDYSTFPPPTTDNRWSLSATPEVVITLPNDSGTRITIGVNPITKTLQNDGYWSASPALGVTHTFKFGDSGDILSDLEVTRQRLEIDRGYKQRIYDFETTIYTKVSEIIGYEMSLLNTEKDLYVLRTKIDNALKLNTMTKSSITYQNLELELNRQENLKSGTTQKMALAKSQFKQITGLEWQSIEKIREANLSFKYLPTGDTTVILAALDLEIAKEELALAQRKRGGSVPNLTLGGDVGLDYSKRIAESLSYSINAQAKYSDNGFTVGSGVNLGISQTGTITPSFTINGSWQNNATSTKDALNTQVLEQNISIVGIAYQDAVLTYQMKANQLEADILSYKLEKEQFEQSVVYKTQVLEKALTAFTKGLIVQAEVDQAKLDVELTNYERKRYALEALMLENRAKALQL